MSEATNSMHGPIENLPSRAGESVQQKVDEATAALGEKMQSVAGSLREKGPREGVLGSASSAVADTLESAGRYVREEGLTGMTEDLTELIRRNPIPAVLVGLGIGFLLAKAFRR
jgi:hypothetical protein